MRQMILAIVPISFAFATPLAGQNAPSAAKEPTPIGSPGGWFMQADYPAAALRAHKSGAVVFTLDVDKQGAPSNCAVTASSGFAPLDQATCRLALKRARFDPARGSDGSPIAATFSHRVTWANPAPPAGMKSTLVTFSGTDTAPICSVTLNDAPRHLRKEMCKSLSDAIVARGGSLDQPVTISVADLPAMLESR